VIKKNSNLRMLIIFALGALLLSGCSFVNVQNVSDSNVTVQIQVPDSGVTYTRQIRSFEIAEVFSSQGGPYAVAMLPDEEYRQLLVSLQQEISQRLFNEGDVLTAPEIAQLVEKMSSIDQLLEELAQPMPSCSGNLPDYETVVVTITYDAASNDWNLTCG
jgi:hypothetical protein